MHPLLQRVFNAFIRTGRLQVTTASGRAFTLGDGSGKPIAVRFTSLAAELGVLLDPELKFGEAYMDGTFIVEEGSIADVIALGMAQEAAGKAPHWVRPQSLARYLWGRFQEFDRHGGKPKKVAHSYDLDGPFYSLFLDADQQYSCAYFEAPDQPLEDAQLAKKRHIAAKLLVNPGNRVLDIGSGWGGMAFYLAETCGASVTGVNLSRAQVEQAKRRADEKDLSSSVEFRVEDYRSVTGVFDRIVSIEMIENVGGIRSYDVFFRKCAELLAEDGVMLLHSSVRCEGPEVASPFISKYLFPGARTPALSELLPAIERAGLLVTDIEILRLHYAETIKVWRERFLAHREEVERLNDARFYRMWEFWLACSEMAFRSQLAMVVQIQMTKRQGVVPITRDYIARGEARLRSMQGAARPPSVPGRR
jgi:cyclopropane-fatty-acyl-phospholipid synthase